MTALLERMPKGVVLAASEYGIIGSHFPDMTIIDLVGLHDRSLLRAGSLQSMCSHENLTSSGFLTQITRMR